MRPCVVVDAGPVIAVVDIGLLDILPALYVRVSTTRLVVQEISPTLPVLPAWLVVAEPAEDLAPSFPQERLDAGEYSALLVAIESPSCDVLLDDRDARRWARCRDLPVIGTVGILGLAKQVGLITEIRPRLDDLLAHNFFLSPDLYEAALRLAGEA